MMHFTANISGFLFMRRLDRDGLTWSNVQAVTKIAIGGMVAGAKRKRDVFVSCESLEARATRATDGDRLLVYEGPSLYRFSMGGHPDGVISKGPRSLLLNGRELLADFDALSWRSCPFTGTVVSYVLEGGKPMQLVRNGLEVLCSLTRSFTNLSAGAAGAYYEMDDCLHLNGKGLMSVQPKHWALHPDGGVALLQDGRVRHMGNTIGHLKGAFERWEVIPRGVVYEHKGELRLSGGKPIYLGPFSFWSPHKFGVLVVVESPKFERCSVYLVVCKAKDSFTADGVDC